MRQSTLSQQEERKKDSKQAPSSDSTKKDKQVYSIVNHLELNDERER